MGTLLFSAEDHVRFSAGSVPELVAGAEGSALGDEFVVLDPPGRVVRGLNGTGARVFSLCDGRRCAAEIAQAIAREYGADEAAVLPDVLAFLETLGARGLVQPREGGTR